MQSILILMKKGNYSGAFSLQTVFDFTRIEFRIILLSWCVNFYFV